MFNQVVLIGRVGRDPELRYTPSGVAVVNFPIAVNRQFKSSTADEAETDWFNVVAWRQQAEFAANYLGKGRLILVQGRLQSRSWVAQDGTKRSAVEVVADRLQGLDRPREQVEAVEDAATAETFVPEESEVYSQDGVNDPFVGE